jgi:hypothetical protein
VSLSEEQKTEVRAAAEDFWAGQIKKGPRSFDDVQSDMQVLGMAMFRILGGEVLEELEAQLKATAPDARLILDDPSNG